MVLSLKMKFQEIVDRWKNCFRPGLVDTGQVYFVVDFDPPVPLSLYLIVDHKNT